MNVFSTRMKVTIFINESLEGDIHIEFVEVGLILMTSHICN